MSLGEVIRESDACEGGIDDSRGIEVRRKMTRHHARNFDAGCKM